MRERLENMKLWEQYRNCYKADDTHYEYYTDDEELIVLDAGIDGVTSAHIHKLKMFHRREINNEDRNHQKRYDGEKTIYKVFSYDAVGADMLERLEILQDYDADPARILNRKIEINCDEANPE